MYIDPNNVQVIWANGDVALEPSEDGAVLTFTTLRGPEDMDPRTVPVDQLERVVVARIELAPATIAALMDVIHRGIEPVTIAAGSASAH